MSRVLISACSSRKIETPRPVMARDLYLGTLFKLSRQYADQNGLEFWILSAKYGFIRWDAMVETYDQRFPKNGSPLLGWPEQGGFYVGGVDYFANAPARFQNLLGGRYGIGVMQQKLKALVMATAPNKPFTLFEE